MFFLFTCLLRILKETLTSFDYFSESFSLSLCSLRCSVERLLIIDLAIFLVAEPSLLIFWLLLLGDLKGSQLPFYLAIRVLEEPCRPSFGPDLVFFYFFLWLIAQAIFLGYCFSRSISNSSIVMKSSSSGLLSGGGNPRRIASSLSSFNEVLC